MRLKEMRQKNNLSQAEMAKILKTTQKTISNYEKELTAPPTETLIQMADYFHVTIDFLLNHNVPNMLDKSIFSPEQQALIDKIATLTREQCEKVDAYIMGMLTVEQERQNLINRIRGV